MKANINGKKARTDGGKFDLAVVGGGLAGLTAALLGARAGKTVVLLEKSAYPGGRGRTTREKGFLFNLGAHALYNNGAAARILGEQGITYSAGRPDISGVWLRQGDTTFALPLGAMDILKIKTMKPGAKLEMALAMAKLAKASPDDWRGRSVRDYFQENLKHESVVDVLRILFVLTTYAGDIEELDMGLFLEQWRVGAGGVSYLDGGWNTLVEGLLAALEKEGVEIMTQAPVTSMSVSGDEQIISYGEGKRVKVGATFLAQDPAGVHKILAEKSPLENFIKSSRPMRAAALDLGIKSLSGGPGLGMLDMGRRIYAFSHSPTAKLAPEGYEVLHGVKYLREGENGADFREELEKTFDIVRPGWRENLEVVRFLPNITVSHALRYSGIQMPGVRMLAESPVYACGDWVSEEGMLLDASLASVERAMQDYLSKEGAVSTDANRVGVLQVS